MESDLPLASDEENEMNIVNTTRKNRILDSDSEDEAPKDSVPQSDPLKSSTSRRMLVDSDSEEELTKSTLEEPQEAEIYNFNTQGELVVEKTAQTKKSIYKELCDSESSASEGEEEPVAVSSQFEDEEKETPIQPVAYKAPKKCTDEPKKMTAKEAAKQRVEIQAESQRMVRESNISLPYHKPKAFTLKQFLEKRSKLPSLPKVGVAKALKMSQRQLEEVSKQVDERIKCAEEFYKSESEEEEEQESITNDVKNWLDSIVENAFNIAEPPKTEIENNTEEPMDVDTAEDNPPKKPSFQELLKEQLANIQPQLSGGPDEIIDLEEGVTRPSEVKKLVDKFFKHTSRKIPHKHTMAVDVVGVGGHGEIIHETISVNVDEEEVVAKMETPGAKLKKLREGLQEQMAQRRNELWKQKQAQGDVVQSVSSEKDGYEEGDEYLDDEEEECEMTESEEEPEEDDVRPEKPRRMKSAFIEEEAEESDADDEEDNEDPEPIEEAITEAEDEEPIKRTLKRVIQPTEDSDEEDSTQTPDPIILKPPMPSTESFDEKISPNLTRTVLPPSEESQHDFCTPINYLTSIQNLSSAMKTTKDTPGLANIRVAPEPSPLKETHWREKLQTKLFGQNLFSDPIDSSQSQEENKILTVPPSETAEEEDPNTQDFLDICSGQFDTQMSATSNTQPEIKELDDDEAQIISQLIDEDELERFRKKFESPVVIRQAYEEATEVNATGFINSDDEGEVLAVKTKKQQKKLVFSDEESEEEREEEAIDLHDEDETEVQVNYDSEENDIDEITAAAKLRAADFLEDEAELSESEWGSADEDERDLDTLEVELADNEKFDENQIRSDLERIHMRQVLDDDNRDVKLLQELLLEDGELHGSGRQRQFRWKNIDSLMEGEEAKSEEEDEGQDDEESEEQWRKMRHKREMYLQSQSVTQDVDTIFNDSQILKVGQKLLIKSQSFNTSQNSSPGIPDSDNAPKQPFSLLKSKRGSFLTRSEQVLQRLAEYSKVSSGDGGGTTVKHSRSFVFQTVEAKDSSISDIRDINNKKRKALDATPNAIKKLRLSDLSPAVDKKEGGKKLFGRLF